MNGNTFKISETNVTEETAPIVVLDFINKYPELFSSDKTQFKLESCVLIKDKDYYRIRIGQYCNGIKVWGKAILLRMMTNGNIATFHAYIERDIKVETNPQISKESAWNVTLTTLSLTSGDIFNAQEELLIFNNPDTQSQHLSWLLHINSRKKNIYKDVYVDAINGEIICIYNASANVTISGTIQIPTWSDIPSGSGILELSENQLVIAHDGVSFNNDIQDTTNASGYYSISIDPYEYVKFLLDGSHARVLTGSTCHSVSSTSYGTVNHTWSGDDYKYDYALFYRMNYIWKCYNNTISGFADNWYYANKMTGYANAYISKANPGSIEIANLYARLTPTYHEYTHNVIARRSGSSTDSYIGNNSNNESSAMDEGFADYFACSFAGTSILPDANGNILRNLDNDKKYENYNSLSDSSYAGGIIIGGACWDLKELTTQNFVNNIVYESIKDIETPLATGFDDFVDLLLYCDDSTPQDGTPHLSSIITAFNTNHHINGYEFKIGTCYTDETWLCSDIYILNDVIIPSGVTVTIGDNVTVHVLTGKGIAVNGTLAVGSNVTFMNSTIYDWDGITINSGGTFNNYKYGAYQKVTIHGATNGIKVNECSPTIRKVHVSKTTTGQGILVLGSTSNPTFYNVTVDSCSYGFYLNNADASIFDSYIKPGNTNDSIMLYNSNAGLNLGSIPGYGNNNIVPKAGYKAIDASNCTTSILAHGNWWGVAPPSAALFGNGLTVDYTYYLASADGDAGAGKIAVPSDQTMLARAYELEEAGKYRESYAAFKELLATETKTEFRRKYIKMMIALAERTDKDFAEIRDIIATEQTTAPKDYAAVLDNILCMLPLKEGDCCGTIDLLTKKAAEYTGYPMEQEMLCEIANVYAYYLGDKETARTYADRAAKINPGCRFLDTAYRACGIDYDSSDYADRSIDGYVEKPADEEETAENHASPTVSVSPNPANPATTIAYTLPAAANVKLSVYSVSGQKVATLVDSFMSAGNHAAVFDGSALASGVYFYRLETKGFAKTGKMVLVK